MNTKPDNIPLLPQKIRSVKATPNRLNNILGRWPASKYNSHKKEEVIGDILEKIDHPVCGVYRYYSSSRKNTFFKEFILFCQDSSYTLFDAQKHLAYQLTPPYKNGLFK